MLEHLTPAPIPPARVVVVGAAGFVGAAVVRQLQARGIETLPLARADIDLLASEAGTRLAECLRPTDTLVATAARAPVKDAAMLRENIAIAETFAQALRHQPVAHVLNIGSDAIYADSFDPLTEESCPAPGSLHGIMHLAREMMLREACGETPFSSLRPTLIYGANDPHNSYGPNRFRRLAARSETIVLFGEGEEQRDHVWVEDVAELALRILLRRSRGILNAATGVVVSFREAAEMIASHFDPPPAIVGSPRHGPMPHGGYRSFDSTATLASFPDFRYTGPAEGFARVHAESMGKS